MKNTPKSPNSSHGEAMAEVRRVVAEAKELSEAADGALTDKLACWVAGRYAIATRQLATSGELDWRLLRDLCHDLVDLRRGDHSAESLRIERERLEMERSEQRENLEQRFWEWAKDNRSKICQGVAKTPQEKERLMREILGISEPFDPSQDGPPPQPETGNGVRIAKPNPATQYRLLKVDKGQ